MLKRYGLAVAYVFAIALAVIPIWTVHHIPMVDLPPHMVEADMWMKLGDPAWRWASDFRVDYFTPYLLGYVVARAVSVVADLDVGFRVVLTLAAVGFPLGALLTLRHMKAPPELGLLTVPLTFGFAWTEGFVNNLVAMPLAFVGIDLVSDERPMAWRRGVVLSVFLVVLFFAHVLAWGFVGLAGVLLAARRSWREPARLVRDLAPLVASLPVVPLWWAVGRGGRPAAYDDVVEWGLGPVLRLVTLPASLLGATDELDTLRMGMAVVLVAAPFVLGYRLRTDRPAFLCALLALALFLVVPASVLSTGFVHQRYAPFVVPLLYASLERTPPMRFRSWPLLVVVPWLVHQGWSWTQFDREARDADALVDAIPPGLRVCGVVTDRTSPHVPGAVFWFLGAAYQLEKDGLYEPSFARFWMEIVQFRDQPAAIERFQDLSVDGDPSFFDGYIVRVRPGEAWGTPEIMAHYTLAVTSGKWAWWPRRTE